MEPTFPHLRAARDRCLRAADLAGQQRREAIRRIDEERERQMFERLDRLIAKWRGTGDQA